MTTPTTGPGPHDTAILTLIANRQPLAAIQQAGTWDQATIHDVLYRYTLTTNNGGSIVRADLNDNQLLGTGLRSTRQDIRNTAERADQMLAELAKLLGAAHAQAHLQVLRRQHGKDPA